MTKGQARDQDYAVDMTPERIGRDDAIEALYEDNPSLRALHRRGQIDQETYEKARRLRDAGPAAHAFTALIAALRAERELQKLSLADIAARTGMDRAAVHKLEIGLNRNPTFATLDRYADALGLQIAWELRPKGQSISASRPGRVSQAPDQAPVHAAVSKGSPKAATKRRSGSSKAEKGTKSSTDSASRS